MQSYAREDLVLGALLERKSREHPGKTFVRFRDTELTYGELNATVNRVAQGLQRAGVRKGDKVAVMLPNCQEFVAIAFALAKLGAVEVPVNTAYLGSLLEHVLGNSDTSVCIIDEPWLERLAAIEGHTPKLKKVIVRQAGSAPPRGLKADMLAFRSLLDAPATAPGADVWHGEMQSIMYTSGTTGPSKGVMVSHAQACTLAVEWLKFTDYTPSDSIYSPLPLFHGIAHTCGLVAAVLADSEISIVERFSASKWWDDIRHFKSTVGHGIFSMVHILMNQPPSPRDKEHALRCFWLGQSTMDRPFAERFGTRIVETYGSTEVGIAIGSPYGQWRPGACGKVNADTYDVKLLDERDKEVPQGTVGEIVVRPKQPFAILGGYYNYHQATLDAFRNLWFHTGDMAYQDKDGYFFFMDRKKDAIRRRGENIAAFDIERVLNMHPAVLESAVIAVPSEMGDDEVKACIVLRQGATLHPEELVAFCDGKMPAFMLPRYVEFLKEMPKTPTEKIEKYKLRAEGKKGITPGTWDADKFKVPKQPPLKR
jgi:crotonobetaine/carnitine-CoA ligase